MLSIQYVYKIKIYIYFEREEYLTNNMCEKIIIIIDFRNDLVLCGGTFELYNKTNKGVVLFFGSLESEKFTPRSRN